MTRRDFAMWLGAGLSGLPVAGISDFAADLLQSARQWVDGADPAARTLQHWRAAQNNTWRWFERSELFGDQWRLTGITVPRHRETGYQVDGVDCADFLLTSEVPQPLREASPGEMTDFCLALEGDAPGPAATAGRRAREGRPPSRWARNLDAEELAVWLDVVEPPRADVGGMTFLEHLTRDHGFREEHLVLLDEPKLAKLHGAAHHGY